MNFKKGGRNDQDNKKEIGAKKWDLKKKKKKLHLKDIAKKIEEMK